MSTKEEYLIEMLTDSDSEMLSKGFAKSTKKNKFQKITS